MTTPEDPGVFVQISRPEGPLEDDICTKTPEEGLKNSEKGPGTPEKGPRKRRPLHPAWAVAAVAFLALVGAAGFRAAPGVLMVPLQQEFGWSTTVLSAAVSINLVLFGLTAPFAAALMERFGIRAVTAVALGLIGAGSALTVLVTHSWQILLTWGLLIGLGTGSMGAGVRGDHRQHVVQQKPGPGDRHPDRRQRCRAAGLPAVYRDARPGPGLAPGFAAHRRRRPGRGSAGAEVPEKIHRPTSVRCLTGQGNRPGPLQLRPPPRTRQSPAGTQPSGHCWCCGAPAGTARSGRSPPDSPSAAPQRTG
jgi:hypothetical protein